MTLPVQLSHFDHQEAHPMTPTFPIFAAGRQSEGERRTKRHQSFHPAVIHHRVDHRVDHHVDHHADHLHDLAAGLMPAYGLQAVVPPAFALRIAREEANIWLLGCRLIEGRLCNWLAARGRHWRQFECRPRRTSRSYHDQPLASPGLVASVTLVTRSVCSLAGFGVLPSGRAEQGP